jgi:hypothetical protein
VSILLFLRAPQKYVYLRKVAEATIWGFKCQ